jgi:hypothetical protein
MNSRVDLFITEIGRQWGSDGRKEAVEKQAVLGCAPVLGRICNPSTRIHSVVVPEYFIRICNIKHTNEHQNHPRTLDKQKLNQKERKDKKRKEKKKPMMRN